MDHQELKLWYQNPALESDQGWEEQALPIGNGDMGAKIFGGVYEEHLQLNEKSLWTGTCLGDREPDGSINTNGNGKGNFGKSLHHIQHLLHVDEASAATQKMESLQGDEIGLGAYQNFGDLFLDFKMKTEDPDVPADYTRSLDITQAVAQVNFSCCQDHYSREYFASYPDKVLAMKIEGPVRELVIRFEPAHPNCRVETECDYLLISGKVENTGSNLLRYLAAIMTDTDGRIEYGKHTLRIHEAKRTVIYFTAATNYGYHYPHYRSTCDLHRKLFHRLEHAYEAGYETVKQRHIRDYQELFTRVSLELGQEREECGHVPTDELLRQYKAGITSRYLEYLLYQYGRYLLISSSRENGLPANLQGVWNNSNTPAWQSDYHLNINLQMNYWLAANTNLMETMLPLLDYVNQCIVIPGRATAYACTGIGDGDTSHETGWMAHTQNNIFGHTGPGSNWRWGWAPTVGAFILENMYDYYAFTQDMDKLEKDIYPPMEEAALLWSQLLVYDDKTKRMIVTPCYSPEHGPVSEGGTFDQEMIWQLYHNILEAAEDLRQAGKESVVDRELLDKIERQYELLSPHMIGKWGQLKEWVQEDDWNNRGFDDMDVVENHRHFSHMLGLYPGNHILPEEPEVFEAARVSMEDRGDYGKDVSPGWSKALKLCAWARLADSAKCYGYVKKLLQENILENLWDVHPPFQIDGNFGVTAGITEMLLQSHGNYIHILPALPNEWAQKGSFQGLRARGDLELDCTWENGRATQIRIKGVSGQKVQVKVKHVMEQYTLPEEGVLLVQFQ